MTPWISSCAVWTDDRPVPAASLLSPSLRRRTSGLTRACAEVIGGLDQRRSVALDRVAMVFGSAYGEIQTTMALLDLIAEEASSPTKFHGSVHNTAAGYVSISCGNRGFSTAIAAGGSTVAAAFLEGLGLLATRAPEVVLVLADESIPPPLTPTPSWRGLAVAFHLTLEPTSDRAGKIDLLHMDSPASIPSIAQAWAENPCAPAMALAQKWEAGCPGTVPLELGSSTGWCIELSFSEGRMR